MGYAGYKWLRSCIVLVISAEDVLEYVVEMEGQASEAHDSKTKGSERRSKFGVRKF